MPYVTVIIAAYNAADFLANAYESVREQTLRDLEVILVNDGSQDNTLAVIGRIAASDNRVKVINLPNNSGLAYARNAATAIAEGEWIATLDADDWYSKDRLAVLTRAGERSAADIVLDNLYVVDPISNSTIFLAFQPTTSEAARLEFSELLRNVQSDSAFDFGYLKPIVRRRWLEKTGVKYLESMRQAQDVIFLFENFARGAHVILLSEPYYYYAIQYNPLTRRSSPKTTTKPRTEQLLAATEQFLEQHDASLSKVERRLVASRCEALRQAIAVGALRALLREFTVGRCVGILRHPIRLLRGIYFAKKRGILLRRRIRRFRGYVSD